MVRRFEGRENLNFFLYMKNKRSNAFKKKYNQNIHRKILEYSFFSVGERIKRKEYDIDELVIRHDILYYINFLLNNQNYRCFKEYKKRYDLAIKLRNNRYKNPLSVYEIKTVIKSKKVNSHFINDIYYDLLKLAELKADNNDCKAYFILIGRFNQINKIFKTKKTLFSYKLYKNTKKVHYSQKMIEVKNFDSISYKKLKKKIKNISDTISYFYIKQSRTYKYNDVVAISWEIRRVNKIK